MCEGKILGERAKKKYIYILEEWRRNGGTAKDGLMKGNNWKGKEILIDRNEMKKTVQMWKELDTKWSGERDEFWDGIRA